MIKIMEQFQAEKETMASAYAAQMDKLMENPDVMELEADLGVCIMGAGMKEIASRHPGQLLNCGIQEANMVGVACGLSAVGKIPFLHSFAPFITRRTNDQIFISGCYSGANIRLVGSDPGVMAAYNGGTHMPFEDVAVLRAFPELTILEPTDNTMLKNLMEQLVEKKGMYYLRTARKTMTKIYEDDSVFTIGKANIVREGTDATILATGIMVAEALYAAEALHKEGISVKVVDMFTIKPLDQEMVIQCAKTTGALVTAENHNIINGLGSAVSEVAGEHYPVPIERIGVQDCFGEVGDIEYLMKAFHLTAKDIAEKVRTVIARKRG